MVDSGTEEQSTGSPLEGRVNRYDHIERMLFLYGLPFLCVSAAFAVIPSITLLFLQGAFLGFIGWAISILCAVISLVIFLLGFICSCSTRSSAYRLRHAICSFGAISVLLIAFVIIPRLEIYASRKIYAKTEHVILQLVSEIESLRQQTGRLPENQSELVKLRGEAMPLSGWRTPLEYFKDVNESVYIVRAVSPDSFWLVGYSSRNPDAGVVSF